MPSRSARDHSPHLVSPASPSPLHNEELRPECAPLLTAHEHVKSDSTSKSRVAEQDDQARQTLSSHQCCHSNCASRVGLTYGQPPDAATGQRNSILANRGRCGSSIKRRLQVGLAHAPAKSSGLSLQKLNGNMMRKLERSSNIPTHASVRQLSQRPRDQKPRRKWSVKSFVNGSFIPSTIKKDAQLHELHERQVRSRYINIHDSRKADSFVSGSLTSPSRVACHMHIFLPAEQYNRKRSK